MSDKNISRTLLSLMIFFLVPKAPGAVVNISVSPTSGTVSVGKTIQFTAKVTPAAAGVIWSVNGVAGGNSTTGTISTSGLYTAPAVVPTSSSVTITATSNADPSKFAQAAVTITAPVVSVTVSPTSVSVLVSTTQQFSATVTGSPNTAVSWSVNGVAGGNTTVGTISPAGLYTGPASVPSPSTVTVVAVSAADSTKSAQASVTVVSSTSVGVSISPTSLSLAVSNTQQFSAAVTGSSNTAVTWSVNGVSGGNSTAGTISAGGLYTAPAIVPSSATAQVTATSIADSTKSAVANVTITLAVSPATTTVGTQQSAQFSASGVPKGGKLSWSVGGINGGNATVGTITAKGLYTAPAMPPNPSTTTITATTTTSQSGQASLTVVPVTVAVSPTSGSVPASQALQFTATVANTSNTAVTWSVNGVTGGGSATGTISTGGLYTAPVVAPPGSVTVAAVSVADTTKSAQATVTVLPVVSVTLSPTSASVPVSQTQQFTAAVSGSSNTSVSWNVNGVAGGNSTLGTVSASGLYTAPSAVPSGSIMVTAISAADTTKSASAAVTVQPAVSITVSPTSASVPVSQTQQFTAAVSGSSNTSVSWNVNGVAGGNSTLGTVSSSGLYTAPSAVPSGGIMVTAISAADTTKSAGATVSVTASSLTISPSSLPNGITGNLYSSSLAVSGGTAPYTWSILSGLLPTGVGLGTATGVISGTPATSGTYNVNIQVADAAGRSGTSTFSFAIAAALTISTTTVPSGTVGASYSFSLASSGGTAPVAWTVASGQLPAGLSLDASGAISGTPTTAGSYTFTIQASDASSPQEVASQAYTTSISSVTTNGTITILNADLPNGTVNAPYSALLTATGGTPPYSWTIAGGALPAGLTLNSSTGAITGTGSIVGWSNLFTVQVQDSVGNVGSLPYSFIIRPVLDLYGGSLNQACSATGWFHAQKIGSRWWLCDPAGGVFFYQGVGGMVPGGSGSDSTTGQSYNLDSVLTAKYGDETYNWALAQNKRLSSWGFNGIGQLSVGSVLPTTTCSGCSWPGGTQPVKLPTTNTLTVSNYAGVNLWGYASGATKNMTFGMNGNYRAWPAAVMDFYDPAYSQWLNNYFTNDAGFQSFANSPWTVGLFIDDTDWFWGMGAGPDFSTIPEGHTNADSAYMVLITSPVQTFNPNPSYGNIPVFYNDPKVYSKTAMASPPSNCSLATPCSLRNYLSNKYSTISALNSAWGSNYTTFDSSGTTVTAEACGTGDGSMTSFTCTLAHNLISPHSVSVSVNGVLEAADCPWFNSGCNMTASASAPYACASAGSCVGSFGGTSSTTIATGGSVPWASDSQLTQNSCAGCGLPQASYWFRTAWHGPQGCGGALSREIGATFVTGSPQVSVSTQNNAGDAPACATGVDIYVSCRVASGPAAYGCAAANSSQPAETLQASNVPYPTGVWTEPVSGLVSGTALPSPLSSIDYGMGTVQVSFTSAPPSGAAITISYTYGGWMFGTGLMDEDGRHTSWLGTNPICLQPAASCNGSDNAVPNASAIVGADLDGWISQFAGQYFSTVRTNFKKHAPNLMYLGADTVGTWGVPARKEILQAAGQYVDALFVNMFPGLPDSTTYGSMFQYLTQYLGDKPLLLFLTAEATPDSALFRYDASGSVAAFSAQSDRGQGYSNFVAGMLNTPGYNGSNPWVGISWWGLYDFWNEKNNWGLVSLKDNPYDGKSSCQAARVDPSGYATGGEEVMPFWQPGTAYALQPTSNAPIQVNVNGTIYIFAPTLSGISGSTPPVWPSSPGSIVIDGTVTWQNIGTKAFATCFGDTIDLVKGANALWFGLAGN